jgi:hypothetical protein
MALTPDLVAQVHRALEDPGPDPNLVYHSQEDYDAVVGQLLAAHVPGEDRWLFAYGSLRTGSNLPEPRVPSTLRYCTSLPGDGNDPRVINTSVLAQPHQTTYFHLRQNAYDRFRGHLRPGDNVRNGATTTFRDISQNQDAVLQVPDFAALQTAFNP